MKILQILAKITSAAAAAVNTRRQNHTAEDSTAPSQTILTANLSTSADSLTDKHEENLDVDANGIVASLEAKVSNLVTKEKTRQYKDKDHIEHPKTEEDSHELSPTYRAIKFSTKKGKTTKKPPKTKKTAPRPRRRANTQSKAATPKRTKIEITKALQNHQLESVETTNPDETKDEDALQTHDFPACDIKAFPESLYDLNEEDEKRKWLEDYTYLIPLISKFVETKLNTRLPRDIIVKMIKIHFKLNADNLFANEATKFNLLTWVNFCRLFNKTDIKQDNIEEVLYLYIIASLISAKYASDDHWYAQDHSELCLSVDPNNSRLELDEIKIAEIQALSKLNFQPYFNLDLDSLDFLKQTRKYAETLVTSEYLLTEQQKTFLTAYPREFKTVLNLDEPPEIKSDHTVQNSCKPSK